MVDAQGTSTSSPRQANHLLIAEIDPPKGTDLDPFIHAASRLKGRVDGVRVTDSENAIMRMSPLVPCLALKGENFDPVMVINGRDRNRISFQADLLAASSSGIEEVVLKAGHDPAEGDQPVARTSGDMDMKTMIECVAALNSGTDLAGEPLTGKTSFMVNVSVDLSDDATVNRQIADSFSSMADAGVGAVTLGPTYDLNILETFIPAAEKAQIQLFTSIMYLKSVAMVRYLNNLPGVPSVPQEFLKKMIEAPVKKDAGLQLACDLFRDLSALGSGTVLLAIGWRDRLPEFLDLVGR